LDNNLKNDVTEKLVTTAWQNLLTQGGELRTESGQSLRVIYAGKTSDLPGSDFQNAVIAVNRHLLKGNIEVHVKSSDWHHHGHHLDPAYNGVVLHVALQHDYSGDIKLQNGDVLQTIAIDRYLKNDIAPLASGQVICAGIGMHAPNRLLKILDRAGAIRFSEKAVRFQNQLHIQAPGQCFYYGIMTALGYARNQAPFQELAERLPLATLESLVKNTNESVQSAVRLQALLLGTAGFLPSQRPECEYSPCEDYAYVQKLETVWETMRPVDVMDFSAWQSFRVRSSNSPLRRLTGLCGLLHRYREKGLLRGLLDVVSDVPAEKSSHLLEDGLMSSDHGYWASRYDFGKGYPGLSKWLIGRSRAADIVINVLLPFVYTWGKENGETELAEKAYNLFLSYPPAATNTVVRHMTTQFGLNNSQVNSVQRQQGLLHLYKKWCTQGRCKECEITVR
jgi:hypothetical protein